MKPALDEAPIRDAARRVLHNSWVEEPGHIDLDALAWRCGLTVVVGRLEHAEGRLVAGTASERGFIRVRDGIQSPGRCRFIVAHELGHFHLHKRQTYTDTGRELSTFEGDDIETEANLFASELLMPDFLFAPRVREVAPSHAAMQDIAGIFGTSQLATVMQYLTCTTQSCALVFSREGHVRWTRTSRTWTGTVRTGALHPESGAAAFFTSGQTPAPVMRPVAPGTWLTDASRLPLDEDTLLWPEQRVALSLLWQK